MDEIKMALDFFKEPNALEFQAWNKETAGYFKNKGYSILQSEDGSFWITDESRYFD